MRFAIPTLVAAIAAGLIGAFVAAPHWSFGWLALAMVGAVVVLGLAALIAAMFWPEQKREPVGHAVGL